MEVRALLMSLSLAALLEGCRGLEDRSRWISRLFPGAVLRPVFVKGAPAAFRVEVDGATLGYLFEFEREARSSFFLVRVVLDCECRVLRVAVPIYVGEEGRGVRSAYFLKQFVGRGPHDPLVLGRDVDAFTGATLSCREVTGAVRKAVRLCNRRIRQIKNF